MDADGTARDDDGTPDEAPGWDALTAQLAAALPDQEPLHHGTAALPDQGIQGISAYRAPGHWVLVTYGMTELFVKVSEDPTTSGWGIELVLRVPRGEEDDGPPAWALELLGKLADYVDSTGKVFAPGHRMDPGGPITGGQPPTRLTAVAFTADPELAPFDSPRGRVGFLAVVGVTAEELERMQASTTAEVVAELAARDPLLVTDPTR